MDVCCAFYLYCNCPRAAERYCAHVSAARVPISIDGCAFIAQCCTIVGGDLPRFQSKRAKRDVCKAENLTKNFYGMLKLTGPHNCRTSPPGSFIILAIHIDTSFITCHQYIVCCFVVKSLVFFLPRQPKKRREEGNSTCVGSETQA